MRLRSSIPFLSTLAFAAALSSVAFADVGPAPSCPTGLRSAYLMGRYCAPVACQSDSDCEGDATCAERAYCVRSRNESQPDALQWSGNCEGSETCSGDERCVHSKFCGPRVEGAPTQAADSAPTADPAPTSPVPAETPSRRRGCGVAMPGASGASSIAVLASIGAMIVARRRRR